MKPATTVSMLALLLAAGPAAAADFDWLAGRWCADADGVQTEEIWTDAAGGLVLGMHRDVPGAGKSAFEFLRIEYGGDTATYVAQPGGSAPTRFERVRHGATDVLFANPQHDFPKRIGYRRTGDVMDVWIDDGSDDGQSMRWQWKRCDAHGI